MKRNISILFAFTALLINSCSSPQVYKPTSAEDVFNQGVEDFKEGDYIDAQKNFDKIKLQYPASAYADDAYFYIAEINYERKQYIVAAYHYNSLRRTHPRSDYAKIALYKTAQCFLEMSPSYDRDQDYTIKAINKFSEFQAFYPDDSLSNEATKTIVQLRNKLAHKEYSTAELYIKLRDLRASIVYFDKVIENYPDTEFFELAYYGKIETLYKMKEYDEAKSIVDLYKKTFPDGEHLDEIKELEATEPK